MECKIMFSKIKKTILINVETQIDIFEVYAFPEVFGRISD